MNIIVTNKYKDLIYNTNIEVIEIACPNWTSYVEGGKTDSAECLENISSLINKMQENKPEKIILGCTHYPFLLPILTKYADKDMFIDPAEIFVKFIQKNLQTLELLNSSTVGGSEQFFVSANPQDFVNNAKLFYEVKGNPSVI